MHVSEKISLKTKPIIQGMRIMRFLDRFFFSFGVIGIYTLLFLALLSKLNIYSVLLAATLGLFLFWKKRYDPEFEGEKNSRSKERRAQRKLFSGLTFILFIMILYQYCKV